MEASMSDAARARHASCCERIASEFGVDADVRGRRGRRRRHRRVRRRRPRTADRSPRPDDRRDPAPCLPDRLPRLGGAQARRRRRRGLPRAARGRAPRGGDQAAEAAVQRPPPGRARGDERARAQGRARAPEVPPRRRDVQRGPGARAPAGRGAARRLTRARFTFFLTVKHRPDRASHVLTVNRRDRYD